MRSSRPNYDQTHARRVCSTLLTPLWIAALLMGAAATASTETIYGHHWNFSRTQPRIRRPCPPLGADNEYVLREILGLDAAEIAHLEAEGALT